MSLLSMQNSSAIDNSRSFFLVTNVSLYICYFSLFMGYLTEIRVKKSIAFDEWVKTLTSVAFLILGICILKYGSNLETTVTHSINLRSSVAK